MTSIAVEARGLGKIVQDATGSLTILDDINLSIAAGETVAIVGASGSGKSTLAWPAGWTRCADLRHRQHLRREHCSHSTKMVAPRCGRADRFRVPVIPAAAALDRTRKCAAAARVDWTFAARAKLRSRRRAICWHESALRQRLSHYPRTLCGGEQQRVALARAFVLRPPLLLADEPTGSLDAHTGEAVIDLMFELNRERGSTLVLVTHDQDIAHRCGRQIELAAGRVVNAIALGAQRPQDSTARRAISPATSPTSPSPSPPRPCSQTAANVACHGSNPCASRAPIIPARTSPVPAVASAGDPVGLMARFPVWSDNHRSSSLSARRSHCSARARSMRGLYPIGLNLGGGAGKQSRRFERVRGQHRARASLSNSARAMLESDASRDSASASSTSATARSIAATRRRARSGRRQVRNRPRSPATRRLSTPASASAQAAGDRLRVPARRSDRQKRDRRRGAAQRVPPAAQHRPCHGHRRQSRHCQTFPCANCAAAAEEAQQSRPARPGKLPPQAVSRRGRR